MRRFLLCLFIFVLMVAGFSSAQNYGLNGSQLKQVCAATFADKVTPDNESTAGFCQGYIASMIDSQVDWKTREGSTDKVPHYCIPPQIKLSQAVRVLKAYMEKHPEQFNTSASTIIYRAFYEAFKCK